MAAAVGADGPAVAVVIIEICYRAVVEIDKLDIFTAIGEFLVGNIIRTCYPGRKSRAVT